MAEAKTKTTKKADTGPSYEVLRPFMLGGKAVSVGEVRDDIPAGSVAMLLQHKKIARKDAKDMTTRDVVLEARRGPGRPRKNAD